MKSKSSSFSSTLLLCAVLSVGSLLPAHSQESQAPKVVPPSAAKWIPMIPEMGSKGPSFAVVFGNPGVIGQPFGGLFRVPAGEESPSHTHTSEYWAVMLSGTESAREKTADMPVVIPPGSSWYQPAKAPHINKCMGPEECVFYVYYPKGMDYHPEGSKH